MKRILSLFTLAMCASVYTSAQRLDITLTDNSVVSYDVSKIQYMEVMPETEPGQLSGYWYLGYRAMSTSTTHYDGTEKLSFNGNVLKWTKSSTEDVFDLTYSEDKKSFEAVNRATGAKSTYTIVTNEPDLLVLKVGSISRYFYKTMIAAHDAVYYAFPNRAEYTDTTKVWNLKGGSTKSTITPMGKHFEKFPAATQEQIALLADPNIEPDFSLDQTYNKWTAKTITLYPFGDPVPADVNQHAIGNCCMCAVFASFAYIYPDFIKSIITKKSNTTYVVKMYDPQGNPLEVAVTNKLLCNSSGGCAQLSGKDGKFTWATIMEKALMKWEGVFGCNGIGGIGTEHAAPPFTGCGESYSFSPDKLFNGEMEMVVDYALKQGLIGVGGFNVGGLLCGTLESVTGHAFTIMYTRDHENYRWSMRNPWGITDKDGVLEIPNRRQIIRTMDFRLVYPGAAAPYKKKNLGGYIPPKFSPSKSDYISPSLLKSYGLEKYGPEGDSDVIDEDVTE